MTAIEIAGTVTGALGVLLATFESKWNWPMSMISVLLLMVVCYEARLFADVGLNGFYFLTSIFGWYSWAHGKTENQDLEVSRTTIPQWVWLTVFSVVFTFCLGYFLSNYTNADLSYTDSATTGISLAAYWMQARKKLENWIVWFLVDFGYIGIYLYKELYSLAVLYLIFVVLCVFGFKNWQKSYKLSKA